MPVIKVWTADRRRRKAIVVSKFDVNEVLDKAKQKLGIQSNDRCKLALELDGTKVDEDEVLKQFCSEVLLIFRCNEEWRKDGVTVVIDDTDNSTKEGHQPIITTYDDTIDQKPDLTASDLQVLETQTDERSELDHTIRRTPTKTTNKQGRAVLNAAPTTITNVGSHKHC